MAFIQAADSIRENGLPVLSADNAIPERHIVIETLRKAAPLLGLKSPVIATLDAMLSCLPPKRNHHTVFASNATLAFRRNGISDRTIRRHAATLQDMGLLIRKDSANKKRFTRHNPSEGKALRFGFDLTPLFQRLPEIAAIATQATKENENISYRRTQIRAIANEILRTDPDNALAGDSLRALRRKLTLNDCEGILSALSKSTETPQATILETHAEATEMSTKDGQNVRHHHKSKTEQIDSREKQQTEAIHTPGIRHHISVSDVIAACPEANQFSLTTIQTDLDIINHARTLAPMIGIDEHAYESAQKHIGTLGTALTVWALMQFHQKIHCVGAYFRALTSGNKSKDFDPIRLIKRLSSMPGKHACG